MNSKRPRLILVQGMANLSPAQCEYLKSAFDVVEVENIAAARVLAGDKPETILATDAFKGNGQGKSQPSPTEAQMEHAGEGLGIVESSGRISWSSPRLSEYPRSTRRLFKKHCLEALELFNNPEEAHGAPVSPGDLDKRPCKRISFQDRKQHFELIASPASWDSTQSGIVTSIVGVIWNITANRALQAKLDAIDAAGSELMRIESVTISKLNMAERLTLVEEKIIRYVKDTLDFDNFEIRLLNRETNQLELVISQGIAPLKVGEVMYAKKVGNGISGYVAASGESYLCSDVKHDRMYREGLDNAASSLTVPLLLYDQVIGVFNIESFTPNVFHDNDRKFAEIFGRYVAAAMNILDLLVVERYTTNEEITQNMLGELSQPLVEIESQAAALQEAKSDKQRKAHLQQIVDAAIGMKSRIEACTSGPRSILGAEEELRRLEPDPAMRGRRVLVADDEDMIRNTLSSLLAQKGCQVTKCATGNETVEKLLEANSRGIQFDLVISDIKLPGCNGYEVFHTAKEINPDTPVILMTGFGYDPNHSIVRASQEGLHSFLFKPFKANQLIELVEKAFAPQEAKQ